MKKCNNCNINVDTPSVKCPICGSVLLGKKEDSTYPKVKRRYNTFNKILIFLLTIAIIINCYIDLQINSTITWSKYVIFGCIAAYIIIRRIMKARKNVMGLLTRYAFLLVGLLLILFWLTKFYVITDWIIPILCLTELILSIFYAIIIKNKYVKKYLNIIVTNILVSFVPLILILFHLTKFNILANISYVLSLISFVGLIIFDYDDLKEELSKIFNY